MGLLSKCRDQNTSTVMTIKKQIQKPLNLTRHLDSICSSAA